MGKKAQHKPILAVFPHRNPCFLKNTQKNEKNLKQNPLGIIAIFASLAEIFGTVILKFLPLEIQKIFVWHVMLFPMILIFFFFPYFREHFFNHEHCFQIREHFSNY